MGGDYTRWTFDPVKDYAEVFKQQGRVDLDADWNELAEIMNRRWRAETMDIIGRAVVPLNTKDAFNITPTGPGQFTIGVGRMYVDGLMAECHGAPPPVYDGSLGETEGSKPIPFTSQPYYPDPSPLPSTASATDLVYLDVWQREVTALQDPDIREKALGGPDTATRMQTVWQVKVLPNVGKHDCGDQIQGWNDLTALSAGRLTTSTVAPAPSPDPCILSPTGGYRGRENRLYRVEVHTAGTVGGGSPAKFKWSRDNGSVVSAVESISAPGGPSTVVKLKSLGRDRVLRFQSGDWVEILDDRSELNGKAGFLTKIISPPDEANRTITVSPSIPAGLFDATVSSRHTRVRRWDQRNTGLGSNVNPATGLIDATAGPLDIEDGIQVSFSDDGSGGKLHVGDYWLFAARTADGSVEPLQKAPPRGILHHYTRLGFITWNASGAGTFADCRQFWPPSMDCTGCCTVTVGDGVDSHGTFTDIQDAINSLGPAGGEVCLGRGVFVVTKSIHIGLSKVIVRGMGWATRIIFIPDQQAGSRVLFDVDSVHHVTLESFFAVAANAEALVRIAGSECCRVTDTALINLNIDPASSTAFDGAVRSGRAIELAGACIDCEIDRNMLLAAKAIVSLASAGTSTGSTAAVSAVPAATGDVNGLRIRENRVLALQSSIFLLRAENVDIRSNQMFGLSKELLARLVKLAKSPSLSRNTISPFQEAVLAAFTESSALFAFQGAAIVIQTGLRVAIVDNTFTGLVGVFSFALLDALIEDNLVLAFAANIVLIGMMIRVCGNFIAGLLAGWIQAGFLVDFISEDNLWLGIEGLVFLPFNAVQQGFSNVLNTGLAKGGFVNTSINAPANAGTAALKTGAAAGRLGLATVVKIQRDVFLTFRAGIRAEGILSNDILIADNSFESCAMAGISWVSLPIALGNATASPHVMDRNAFNISGVGILCRCVEGAFRGNRIQSPSLGLDLLCQFGVVQNNFVTGTGTQGVPAAVGQIIVEGIPASNDQSTSFQITGNHLRNGSGHGILVNAGDDVRIQDNVIETMAGSGISQSSKSLKTVRVTGNDISKCAGGGAAASLGFIGAIFLPDVEVDLHVHGNRLIGNSGVGMRLASSNFGQGNSLRLRIQDNSIQDDTPAGNLPQSMIVGNGRVIQFTGNQCRQSSSNINFGPLVQLTGELVVANGNTITGNSGFTGGLAGLELDELPTIISGRVIATSNIVSGQIFTGGFAISQTALANNFLI